jgi:MFS family permease
MRGWMKLVLVILSLIVLYWPGIQYHWETAKDPYFVPYDASQYIPAFFKYDRTDPIPTTYAKEYYLNAVCPALYKWSTAVGAHLTDVRHFQLGMMYLAYAVFLGVLGRLAWVLGGPVLSFAVLALTISAWIFIGLGFIGGAPRMYAYPLITLVLYALILDRPYLLAATAVLGALLYPIVAMIGGSCLAGWLILKPFSAQGSVSHWPLWRRLTIVALAGSLTIAVAILLMLGSKPYDRRVVEADVAAYPEAGPDGNYRPYDSLPYKLFGVETFTYFVGPLYSHGDPMAGSLNIHKNLDPVNFLFALAVMGLIVVLVIQSGMKTILKNHRYGGIRLIGFFVVCVMLHIIAWLAAPYLYMPTRFFMFSLPFLITFIFPWSLYSLLGQDPRLQQSPKLRQIAFLIIIGVYLVAFGGRGNVEFAEYSVEKPARPLFDAIAALPRDAVIAGWPLGAIRKMEYVTRRNAFLTGDLHQVLHLTFMKVMRERMDANFEAYLSTDAAPLYRLRNEFGVTHLIVETRDFTDPKHMPEYFAPWTSRIGPRLAEIKGKELLLDASLHKRAAVFKQDGFVLLDLARLP